MNKIFQNRSLAVILLLLFLFSAMKPQSVSAMPINPVAKEAKILSSPKEDFGATTNASVVFAGKGPEGSLVKIAVYWKYGEEYKLTNEVSFKIESLGAFIKEVDLYPGDNRIQVNITHKDTELFEIRDIKYSPKSDIDLERLIKNASIRNMPKSTVD